MVVLQEAWLRTNCIAIQWTVLWLRQGSAVLQYSHCSGNTTRRRWAERTGAGLGVQALGWACRRWAGRAGNGQARRAQAWALGRVRGARTGAGRVDGRGARGRAGVGHRGARGAQGVRQARAGVGSGTAGRAGGAGNWVAGTHAAGRARGRAHTGRGRRAAWARGLALGCGLGALGLFSIRLTRYFS